MAAIFEGGQTCLTLFWKGTTQGTFHQSLVQNGYVVSEELMIMWTVYDYNRDKNEHPPLSSNHWTQKKPQYMACFYFVTYKFKASFGLIVTYWMGEKKWW
jgi:hypothetical protein